MNRIDLTYRLRQLGIRKPEFAAKMGIAPETVYQWNEVPQYAVTLLELLEEVARLKLANEGLRGVAARKAPSRINDDVPLARKGK